MKVEGKDQESIQSSTAPDPGYHMGKWQMKTQENITLTRTKRSVLSKQVTTRLQWTDKKAWQARNINNKKDQQKRHPFKPNWLAYPYHLDEPISILGVLVGCCCFSQTSNFNTAFCKQTVKTLIRRRTHNAASDLSLHCLPMSYKKDARLTWISGE